MYDPYFILDITNDDPVDIISKKYRQKIKLFHPDKYTHKISKNASQKDKDSFEKQRVHHMLVLNEAYDYILTQKENTPVSKGLPTRINIPTRRYEEIGCIQDVSNDKFNEVFMKNRGVQPQDHGYGDQTRLKRIEDYKELDYKPPNLFNDRSFSHDEFNKMFELNKHHSSNTEFDGALIHHTSDGFAGFNASNTDGFAPVASYNGVLLAGDTTGEAHGYYDTHYSDYKHVFSAPQNPTVESLSNLKSPDVDTTRFNLDLKTELEKRLMERDTPIERNGTFRGAGAELNKRQMELLKSKIESDKDLVMQYRHMYDQNLIEDAVQQKLDVSHNYISHINTDLTWEENLGMEPTAFLEYPKKN